MTAIRFLRSGNGASSRLPAEGLPVLFERVRALDRRQAAEPHLQASPGQRVGSCAGDRQAGAPEVRRVRFPPPGASVPATSRTSRRPCSGMNRRRKLRQPEGCVTVANWIGAYGERSQRTPPCRRPRSHHRPIRPSPATPPTRRVPTPVGRARPARSRSAGPFPWTRIAAPMARRSPRNRARTAHPSRPCRPPPASPRPGLHPGCTGPSRPAAAAGDDFTNPS